MLASLLLCIAASHALRGPAVHRPRRLAPRHATALDSLDKAVDDIKHNAQLGPRATGRRRRRDVRRARGRAGARFRAAPLPARPERVWSLAVRRLRLAARVRFLGLHVLRRRKGTSRKRELPPTPEIGKRALLTTISALAIAYRWSGYVAALVDGFVYRATPSATPAMGRALQVLGGHLAWLVVGVSVLAVVPAL